MILPKRILWGMVSEVIRRLSTNYLITHNRLQKKQKKKP